MRGKPKPLPTQKRLKELFKYKDGCLYWKMPLARCVKKGGKAGNITNKSGYVTIGINNQQYSGHRLIWKMFRGQDPIGEIDHINGDRLDNRIENLRDVSIGENTRNAKLRCDNKYGYPGIYWHKRDCKWEVYIGDDYVGRFKKKKDAVAARLKAEKKNKYHKNHGRTG